MTPLLTLRAAAARMGCSWKTLWSIVHAGQIPHVRLTEGPKAQIFLKESDLDAFVARRTRRPAAAMPSARADENAGLFS